LDTMDAVHPFDIVLIEQSIQGLSYRIKKLL